MRALVHRLALLQGDLGFEDLEEVLKNVTPGALVITWTTPVHLRLLAHLIHPLRTSRGRAAAS